MRAIEDKAATGSGEAQHDMGALYTSGQSGVPINYDRAIFWFREAAQNGIANARYNLGVMYQQGLGLDKDMNQALAWYRSAALLEHPEARYNLGIAYLEGIGVTYNPAMAAGYFEQAARTGVVEAAYNLGLILENGLIDEPRPFEGLFWYKLAMDGGSTDGIRSFNRLSQALKLSPVTWQNKYTQMLAERPDLQALAASREKRVVSLNTGAPSVRIHRGMGATAESNPETSNGPARLSPPTAPTQRATVDFSDLVPPASTTPNTNATTPQPTPAQARETVDRQTIARIQTMLTDEGLYRGAADGLMGPATRRAIRAYQQKHALGVDGQPSTTLMAQMLARRIAGTIEPAAGDTPTAATPRTAPFRVNN
jgi:TPR repeat protein